VRGDGITPSTIKNSYYKSAMPKLDISLQIVIALREQTFYDKNNN
jgi:hypothetical protein